jgi:photosystem II stability/assembly factor-like uncharacterized protein
MKHSMKIVNSFIVAALLLIVVSASSFPTAAPAPAKFQLQAESPQFWNLVDHNAK